MEYNYIPPIKYFAINPKGHLLEKHVKNNFPDFYKILMEYPKELKFSERVYWYYHGLTKKPICPICNEKYPKFISFNEGYLQFCSHKCSMQSHERVEKIKRTNTIRYGVPNVSQSKMIKEKKKQTLRRHYDVDIPLQSKIIQERQQDTIMKKYGVKNISQNEAIKKKKLKSKYLTIINSNENIIDVQNGMYIIKCPHLDCTMCNERYFEIPISRYSGRINDNTELCTKLLPIQHDRISNTSIELFVQNILDIHNIQYETNNRSILNGKELDIYIPDYKLAIECNGIYWHSLKEPKYHYEKWRECRKHDIQLITLWEDQIINKPEVVKNIILSRLGIYETRIGANKCKIKKVPVSESITFLKQYHLQGSVIGSIRLGLYYKDELVSIMVFGKKRKALGSINEKNTWELYRYCSKNGISIIHGAERLFKHFVKEYHGVVESFSSNDISMGDLYKKLGFTLINEQHNSYWYIDKHLQRHHRYSFRKDILVKNGADPNLTELEITSNMGLYKIYDSGQQKWGYNSKKNII